MCDSTSHTLSREVEKQKRIYYENECEKKKLERIIEMLRRDRLMQKSNLERDKCRLRKAKQMYVNLCNAKSKLHKALLQKEQEKQDLEEEVKHISCRINLMNTRIEMENLNLQKLAVEICNEDQYDDIYCDDVVLNLESTGGDLCVTANDLHCITKRVNNFYWKLKYLSLQMAGDCVENALYSDEDICRDLSGVSNKSCQSSVELDYKCMQTSTPKITNCDSSTQTKSLNSNDCGGQTDECKKLDVDTQTISYRKRTVSTACGNDHVVALKRDSSTCTTDSWPVNRSSSIDSEIDCQPVTSTPNPGIGLSSQMTPNNSRRNHSPRQTQDNRLDQIQQSFPERDYFHPRVQSNKHSDLPSTVRRCPTAISGIPYSRQPTPPNLVVGTSYPVQSCPNTTNSGILYQAQQLLPPIQDRFGNFVNSCTSAKEQQSAYQNSPMNENHAQQSPRNNQTQHYERPQQDRDDFLICSTYADSGSQQSTPLKTYPTQCFPSLNERPVRQCQDMTVTGRTNYHRQDDSPRKDKSAKPLYRDDQTLYQKPPINERPTYSHKSPSLDRLRTTPSGQIHPVSKVQRFPQIVEENSFLQEQYPEGSDLTIRQAQLFGPSINQSVNPRHGEQQVNQVKQCFPDREYSSTRTQNTSPNRNYSEYQPQQYAPLTNPSNYITQPSTADGDRNIYVTQQYQPTNQPSYQGEFVSPKSVRQPGQSVTENPSTSCFQSNIINPVNSSPRYPPLPQSSMLLCKEFEPANKNFYNNNSPRNTWDDGNLDHVCNTSSSSFRETRRGGDGSLEQTSTTQTKEWAGPHPNISTASPRRREDIRPKSSPVNQRDVRYPSISPSNKTTSPRNGAKFKGRLNIKSDCGDLFNGTDKVSGIIKFGDQISEGSGLQESTTQDSSDSDVDNKNNPAVYLSPSKQNLKRVSHSPRRSTCRN